MEQNPKVLFSSSSLTSEFASLFPPEAKDVRVLMEPDHQKLIERASAEAPDLILIDFGLLDETALQMLRLLREQQACPILVLLPIWTAESALSLYEVGVDDCLIKPVDVKVVTAKIYAWLRRRVIMPVEMLNFLRVGKIFLDPHQKALIVDDTIFIHLSNIETCLLYVLMSRAGRSVPMEDLVTFIWKSKEAECQKILMNTMVRLRQKLELGPANLQCISSVTGFGYKFDSGPRPVTGRLIPAAGPEVSLSAAK